MTELRLSGLDDLTDSKAVAEAMARVGGCGAWKVQVGVIRRPRGGLGSVWIRCPSAAAKKLAEAARVQIGWVMARVEALRARPAQCFKCLRAGHTIGTCNSPVNRGGRCYRCGDEGHVASLCEKEFKCPLCADMGRPEGHRYGGPACNPPPEKKEGSKKRVEAANSCSSDAASAGNIDTEEGPAPGVMRAGSSQEEAMDTAH
ncbi:uncharacterized protein C683.02c-like [Solenopsis invicta]|uniref:uncharacterized protein C683.02c-like n=1 Tax=Solenopsis invicta TaxID=13686 RepID=UPI00193E42A4|nr:uncharacterized protein C683.02c-like [Solenopsis invicta]